MYQCEHFIQTLKTPMRDIEIKQFKTFEETLQFYKANKGTCWNGWSYPQEVKTELTCYCSVCQKPTKFIKNQFKLWECTEHKP